MKKAFRYFLVCMLFMPIYSTAQYQEADSIYLDFERCLSSYFKGKYNQVDSSRLFFYGNRFNVNMELTSIDLGSGKRYITSYNPKFDSIQRSDTSYRPFFYRGLAFDEFMNYMIEQVATKECILRKEKGAHIFVDCTMENWQHFYFDKLIYKDGFYVTPTVDVLQSDGKQIEHIRYILICYYTFKDGFRVVKKHLVRKTKVCS